MAEVEKVNPAQYKKVYKEVTHWLDRHENELIPQVSLSSKRLIFDDLVFNRVYTQNVQLQNIGKSPVQYQIIDSRLFSPDKDRYPTFSSDIGITISPSQVIFAALKIFGLEGFYRMFHTKISPEPPKYTIFIVDLRLIHRCSP